MTKGTELQRRDAVNMMRSEMGLRADIYDQRPRWTRSEPDVLFNAEGMLWLALYDRYGDHEKPLMSEVAADLGVNDELTRLILLRKREPSKAFLDAVGYERVVLYRKKEG